MLTCTALRPAAWPTGAPTDSWASSASAIFAPSRVDDDKIDRTGMAPGGGGSRDEVFSIFDEL
jgi:hypothetical protein